MLAPLPPVAMLRAVHERSAASLAEGGSAAPALQGGQCDAPKHSALSPSQEDSDALRELSA